MGRFATYIAGWTTSADNLPGQLPNVSLIDALLPRIISGSSPGRKKPLNDKDKGKDGGSIRGLVTHTDVTKNKKGRLVMVQHRDKFGGTWSGGDGRQSTPQIAEKDAEDKGSNGDKAEEKKDGSLDDENNNKFTPDQDAKIIELKASNPGMPWAKVGAEIKRDKEEAKERYKELQRLGKVPSGDAKGDSKQTVPKPKGNKLNDCQQNGNKKDEPKKESSEEIKWTSAEDSIIRQGVANNDKVPAIVGRLKARTNKEVGQRVQYMKTQHDGEQLKKEADQKEMTDKKTQEGGNEGQNGGNMSKKEKRNAKKKEDEQQNSKQGDLKPTARSKKAISKAGSKAGSSRSEVRFTMGEWMTLQEDDMFSFRELQLLSELIAMDARESRDGAYSWLRVASLFADRTDRRVHPEDIREKFEAMHRD